MATVTALDARRHRHSPRIRRRARDWGIDADAVPGTGPGGRVTEDDLRAALRPAAPSADGIAAPYAGGIAAQSAGGIAALQLAVPPALAGDRDALLATVAAAALAALRRQGVAAEALGLTSGGRTSVVSGAHDLTGEALRRRLAERPPDAPCDVRVIDADAVDALVGLPRPGEHAVLAVSRVRDDVAVQRGADGVIAFAARRAVTITVATASPLAESFSADVLRQVGRALASP